MLIRIVRVYTGCKSFSSVVFYVLLWHNLFYGKCIIFIKSVSKYMYVVALSRK